MKNLFRTLRIPLAALFLMAWVLTAVSYASEGPRWRRHRQHNGGTQSVAEPAAIALLGAGLVSLGIYAKKKRGKKQ